MNPFGYTRAQGVDDALATKASTGARVIAGGTNLVDLMKYDVEHPDRLLDINRLPLREIEELPDGGLRIGALVTNARCAYDPRIAARYPLLANAILSGASPQLRNAATTGGNLMQRTRCYYFYDAALPCNKRQPGSGCPAIGGVNRIHAILGTSEHCIATHPSDMCVALAALQAVVNVKGPNGERRIAMAEFHRLPADRPDLDTTLRPDELILSVDLPATDFGRNFTYLKLRDRASYAFALVSVAAGLVIEGGRIVTARLALGGVAHKPWRDRAAETRLEGQTPDRALFEGVADAILADAKAQSQNGFKIPLARRAIVRALQQAADGTPQTVADKTIQ